MKHFKTIALLGLAGMATLADVANAQIVLGPPRFRAIETPGPVRGYSGFVRQGARSYYCDYVRYPNRSCSVDRAGRERCRIVNWRMEQRCY